MSSKPGSWQSVQAQRNEVTFVGRSEEIQVFERNFSVDPPKYMVFSITGEGGVGKSTLLRRYEYLAQGKEINANVVICDDKYLSSTKTMRYIADILKNNGFENKEFNERYKKYREICQQIESDPNVPRGVIDVLARGITDFSIKSLRKAPGVGLIFDIVDEKAAGDAVAELAQYSIAKWGNKDEVELVREPEKILTPLFLELIRQATESKRLIIMFDVFERTKISLSPWLLALLNFEYGDINTKTIFIISGRDPLEQEWTQITNLMCHLRLEPFSYEETIMYLRTKYITDVSLVKMIHQDAGGLPVLVELLAGTNPKPGLALPDISQDAVNRFLKWTTDEEHRKVALLAAVPRHFNREILSAILNANASNLFQWLTAQSYIRSNALRGWFYHERVRELLIRYQKQMAPKELASLHNNLEAYFSEMQSSLDLGFNEYYRSAEWRQYELERLYHMLNSAPGKNLGKFTDAFMIAFFYRWRFSGDISRIAQQVAYETASSELEKEAMVLSELVSSYEKGDYEQVLLILNQVERSLGNETVVVIVFLSRRAEAYMQLENYDQALSDIEHVIALEKNNSWAIAIRGEIYLILEQKDKALVDFNHSIDLNTKYTRAICNRGETYRLMHQYDQALSDYNMAISLNENYATALAGRGDTFRLMGQYDEALVDFNRAINLDNNNTWAIASRGETYRLMHCYDAALNDFNRAIELDQEYIWAYVRRGQTFKQKGSYNEALADFNIALQIDNKDARAIAGRGDTYRLMQQYDKALADYNIVINLNHNYSRAIAARGETYRLMGRYDEALVDLNRAIDLDCEYTTAIASRGQVFNLLGLYASPRLAIVLALLPSKSIDRLKSATAS